MNWIVGPKDLAMCIRVAEEKRRTGEPNEDEYIVKMLNTRKTEITAWLDKTIGIAGMGIEEMNEELWVELEKIDYALSAYRPNDGLAVMDKENAVSPAPTFKEMRMEKLDMKYRPSAEYRYWLYDPEGDGMVYFRTQADRDKQAATAIDAYLDDGWAEEVELVAAGELTHFAQVLDKTMRPADEDLDEEQRDGAGCEWPEGMAWRGNYEMAPLETPNAGIHRAPAGRPVE